MFSILATVLLAAASMAIAAESPQSVAIDMTTYAGTGCRIGSAMGSVSEDASILSILFDEFVAAA